MTMQLRPLQGAGPGGAPPSNNVGGPSAIPVGAPVVLHTLDTTPDTVGGPFPNVVTLAVHNNLAMGNVLVTITVAMAGTLVKSLAPGETWLPLVDAPLLRSATSPAAASQITASADVVGAVAYGSFGTQT